MALGSHEVAKGFDSKSQNGLNRGCFEVHMLQNVSKSMSSLISQSCGDSLPAVLARQVGAI